MPLSTCVPLIPFPFNVSIHLVLNYIILEYFLFIESHRHGPGVRLCLSFPFSQYMEMCKLNPLVRSVRYVVNESSSSYLQKKNSARSSPPTYPPVTNSDMESSLSDLIAAHTPPTKQGSVEYVTSSHDRPRTPAYHNVHFDRDRHRPVSELAASLVESVYTCVMRRTVLLGAYGNTFFLCALLAKCRVRMDG